jgi:hypothetical protein
MALGRGVCDSRPSYPAKTPRRSLPSSIPLVGVARPRRCPATTPAVRRATRDSVTQLTRRPWRRSSRSCARPPTIAMVELRRLAARAGVRRRFAPHQLRHAHALELAREGVALNIIQSQLGHANLGTTSIYLQGIDTEEIIATVHARRAPMRPHRRTAALTERRDSPRRSTVVQSGSNADERLKTPPLPRTRSSRERSNRAWPQRGYFAGESQPEGASDGGDGSPPW